jgi:hypothetical protein
MLHRLLLASLVLLPLTAAADGSHPSPPTPPRPPPGPPKMCSEDGRIIFTSTDRSLAPQSKAPLKMFVLKDTGRWALSTYVSGKLSASSEGCLAVEKAKAIRDSIDHAEWKRTPNAVVCDAVAATATDYEGTGHRKLFTNEICSAESLDPTSAKHLSEILLIVSPLVDPPAATELHDGKR